MEWTRDKTLSLINEYRKRRGLWDMTHDDYRKKEMKQKLLIEVSGSLGGGIPIIEIEKKFHTLRTQYHREINRMKRKEPYNSKWFGFKNLQFLSSPKACRSNKGRISSGKEITEEGTVTTKYIIREAASQLDISGGSANSNNSVLNEEFLTIHRKPVTTITYEVAPAASSSASVTSSSAAATAAATAAASSRAHELEKLIEETTKDVEEIEEERKPKMTIKQINVEQHHHQQDYESDAGELQTADDEPLLVAADHQIHEEDEAMETVELHTTNADDEIAYQSSNSTGGGGGGGHHQTSVNNSNNNNVTTQAHHHQQPSQPTRIIKVQRRDTSNEDDYYEHHLGEQSHHHHQPQQQQYKRIHYDANGHQHTTTIINTAPTVTQQPSANSTLLNPASIKMRNFNVTQQPASPSSSSLRMRDEFATYGEYVANEMRGITDRGILLTLKHKINTALFEASMAELQK